MNCRDAREYVFAFLDDELDSALSIEMQRHLDHCPQCAQEAEIERAIRKRLAEVVAKAAGPIPSCDAQCDAIAGKGERRESPWGALSPPMRRVLGSALATAAVVVLAIGLRSRSSQDTPLFLSGPPLATLLVRDYEHYVSGRMPLQIASAEHGIVSKWLTDETRINVSLPASEGSARRLVGGRKCVLGGRNAAFSAYDMRGSAAALVVMSDEAGALHDMREVRHGDRTHWVAQRDGHTVVACRRDRLIYAAVSTLPENELLNLMDVTHEGN